MNFIVKLSQLDGGQIVPEFFLIFRSQRIPLRNQLSILGLRQSPLFPAGAYLRLKIQNDRLKCLNKRGIFTSHFHCLFQILYRLIVIPRLQKSCGNIHIFISPFHQSLCLAVFFKLRPHGRNILAQAGAAQNTGSIHAKRHGSPFCTGQQAGGFSQIPHLHPYPCQGKHCLRRAVHLRFSCTEADQSRFQLVGHGLQFLLGILPARVQRHLQFIQNNAAHVRIGGQAEFSKKLPGNRTPRATWQPGGPVWQSILKQQDFHHALHILRFIQHAPHDRRNSLLAQRGKTLKPGLVVRIMD